MATTWQRHGRHCKSMPQASMNHGNGGAKAWQGHFNDHKGKASQVPVPNMAKVEMVTAWQQAWRRHCKRQCTCMAEPWRMHGNEMATPMAAAWHKHGKAKGCHERGKRQGKYMATTWRRGCTNDAEAPNNTEPGTGMTHTWQKHGNGMATAWRNHGNTHGKDMALAWHLHGKGMAAA